MGQLKIPDFLNLNKFVINFDLTLLYRNIKVKKDKNLQNEYY